MMSTVCLRCGICCKKGGPTLHQEDLHLLEHIPMRDMVCLREGEMAFDPRSGSLQPLPAELLKIGGKEMGWECVYFHPQTKACSIYTCRPLECRSLFCADTAKVFQAMATPSLSRENVVPRNSGLWACIEEHERNFSVDQAMRMLKADKGREGAICFDLDDLVRRETYFRKALGERVQAADRDLWAYLGRPLWLVLLPMNPLFSRYERL
jgi:Fe-S-cluster containining protein